MKSCYFFKNPVQNRWGFRNFPTRSVRVHHVAPPFRDAVKTQHPPRAMSPSPTRYHNDQHIDAKSLRRQRNTWQRRLRRGHGSWDVAVEWRRDMFVGPCFLRLHISTPPSTHTWHKNLYVYALEIQQEKNEQLRQKNVWLVSRCSVYGTEWQKNLFRN